MRILDLGCGFNKLAAEMWPDDEVITVDIAPQVEPDIVADVCDLPDDLQDFDIILASHLIEHMQRAEAAEAVADWCKRLKIGGKLIVLVPDLTWAAEQIVMDRMNVGLQMLMYGAGPPPQAHFIGFTVKLLRSLMREPEGMVVQRAVTDWFEIRAANDEIFPVKQIIAEAVRVR